MGNKNSFISLVLASSLLIPGMLVAADIKNTVSKKRLNNDIDTSYGDKYEKGYYYYQDPVKKEQAEPQQGQDTEAEIEKQNNNSAANTVKELQPSYDTKQEKIPKGVEALLTELLKEARKQTKLQTEIRDILKEQFAPEPKIAIKPDGTRCIENSSADCFVMPLIPEAKRIPVMAAWLSNPTVDNAKNYLQWQAKYFGQLFDIGNSIQFSIAQFGTEAYPLGFHRGTFNSTTGAYDVIKEKQRLKTLSKMQDVSFDIYLGDDIDLDIFAMDNIASIMSQLPKNKFTLIFKDNPSYLIFESGSKMFKDFVKTKRNHNVTTKVDPALFKSAKIQTTPTYAIAYMKNGKRVSAPFVTGRVDAQEFASSAIRYLEYDKKLDRKDSVDYETWKESGNYSQEHLEHIYGLKLDKNKIKGIYNGN